jgi:hypothetical protein
MNQFIQLPGGSFVNLSRVSRVVPLEDETLELYFAGADRTVLKGEGASAFRKKSGLGGPFSNSLKTAIFWLTIIAAMLLVYTAVRSRG